MRVFPSLHRNFCACLFEDRLRRIAHIYVIVMLTTFQMTQQYPYYFKKYIFIPCLMSFSNEYL